VTQAIHVTVSDGGGGDTFTWQNSSMFDSAMIAARGYQAREHAHRRIAATMTNGSIFG
jgi:hypothetical protein